HDLVEGLEAIAAVDHGGVFELFRDRAVVTHHQPCCERQHDRGIRNHERSLRVDEFELRQDEIKRNDHERLRHQVRNEHGRAMSDSSVLTTATRTVLAYQVGNGSCVNRNTKCSSDHGDGQNMLWICWIWSVLLKAVTKMK